MTSEIPLVGLALGNSAYDRDLELVLPNGRSCPASDHALPAFALGAEKMTMHNGVAEVAGTVFKCAGKTSDGGIGGQSSTTACSKQQPRNCTVQVVLVSWLGKDSHKKVSSSMIIFSLNVTRNMTL